MNLEKIVSECLGKHRSNSLHASHRYTTHQQVKTCRKVQKNRLNSRKNSYSQLFVSDGHKFEPNIHELPKNLYKNSAKTQCSREQIVERLLNDKRNKENQWARQKLLKEEQKFITQCTFQPQINENSKKILKTQCSEHYLSTNTNKNPFQRLYSQGINKIKLSQTFRQANNSEAIEKQNCSFQPETNYRNVLNSENNLKPIYQRIEQIMKEKRDYLHALKQRNKEQQMQQKPSLNANSNKLISNKEEFKKNILKRITNYIQEQRDKKKKYEQEKQKKILQGCTFKPEVNYSGITLGNFQHRQQEYIQKLNEKLYSRMKQQEMKHFRPQLNRISELLVSRERAEETWEDKINRISSQQNGKEDKILQLEQQIYRQCTFQPEINLISKELGEQSRKMSHTCAKHTCDNMVQKEEHCEFRPKINKISQYLVKMKRQNGEAGSKTKRSNVDYLKMEAEYKQMKQCTFQPKINTRAKSFKTKTQPSINQIAGFDAYYKKVNKIMIKKEQGKKRQEQLFNLQKKYQYRKSTKPQQFRLSQGFNHKQAIKNEEQKKFDEVCTFKPKINNFR